MYEKEEGEEEEEEEFIIKYNVFYNFKSLYFSDQNMLRSTISRRTIFVIDEISTNNNQILNVTSQATVKSN